MNTIPEFYASLRLDRPKLGTYLIDFGDEMKSIIEEMRETLNRAEVQMNDPNASRSTLYNTRSELGSFRLKLTEILANYRGVFRQFLEMIVTICDEIEDRLVASIESDY